MAQTFTHPLTHAIFSAKVFLRPLRGLSRRWSTLPRVGRPGLLSAAPSGLTLWKEIRKGVAA